MRRGLSVLVVTVASIALLAGFHTTPAHPASTAVTTPSSASAPPPSTAPPSGAPPRNDATTTPTTSAALAARRTVDGPPIDTRFGYVQVRVVLDGSRIVDVQALQLPYEHPRSERISEQAGPWLHDEAIRAQSAEIDTISGATYTSAGYRQSLQAALDKARG